MSWQSSSRASGRRAAGRPPREAPRDGLGPGGRTASAMVMRRGRDERSHVWVAGWREVIDQAFDFGMSRTDRECVPVSEGQ